jgi:hypothetical protein
MDRHPLSAVLVLVLDFDLIPSFPHVLIFGALPMYYSTFYLERASWRARRSLFILCSSLFRCKGANQLRNRRYVPWDHVALQPHDHGQAGLLAHPHPQNLIHVQRSLMAVGQWMTVNRAEPLSHSSAQVFQRKRKRPHVRIAWLPERGNHAYSTLYLSNIPRG